MRTALFWYFSVPLRVLLCCICAPEFIRLTRVMVYPVGEDSLCRGLSICLRGRHASKTIYTNGGRDAGHCGGTDAWRSAATCSHRAGEQGGRKGRQRQTMSITHQGIVEKFCFDWPPSNSANVRGAGEDTKCQDWFLVSVWPLLWLNNKH